MTKADERMLHIPLYHGTSSYFLEYIQKYGLGAFDILSGLKSREFFKAAWNQLLVLSSESEREKLVRDYGSRANAIMENSVSGGGFNWRYGSVYWRRKKSVTYAGSGHGSELVRLGNAWLDEVGQLSADVAYDLMAEFPAMRHCLAAEHTPIVIKISEIELQYLRTERGEVVDRAHEDFAQSASFEVVRVLNTNELEIFRAENIEWGFIGAVKYDLVPLV